MKNSIEKYLNKSYEKISFILGAGASTSAGIPDFRSNNGVYKNVQEKYNLKDPTLIFNFSYFKKYPHIYYDYIKNRVDLSLLKPTITHEFIKKVQDKNKLNYVYTQNVDCLEIKAGVEENRLIQCHGRYDKIVCINCYKENLFENFERHRKEGSVCYCEYCITSPVKPAVIFFGEKMPERFYKFKDKIILSDLVIVLGTSLSVSPFNSLIKLVRDYNCMLDVKKKIDIILINKGNSLNNFINDQANYLFIDDEVDNAISNLEKLLELT